MKLASFKTTALAVAFLLARSAEGGEVRVELFHNSRGVARLIAKDGEGNFVLRVADQCDVTLSLYGISDNSTEIGLACSSVCAGSLQIGEQTNVALSKERNFSYVCGRGLRIKGKAS